VGKGSVYTPDATRRHEEVVRTTAIVAMGNTPPIRGPVKLVIVESRVIPASWPPTKREAALRGEIQPVGKPDIDNVAKLIKDALNGICYDDDAQVCLLVARKMYAADAQVEVEVVAWP
jgi:Holliday junction resolvase RusA-like endonuclease